MKLDYELLRSSRRSISIEIKRDGRIVVRAPYAMSTSDIEKLIDAKSNWIEKHIEKARSDTRPSFERYTEEEIKVLKEKARKIIPPLCEYYSDIVGVKYSGVKINRARGRFGSCNSKGGLNFSCFLMLYPTEAIEYVVVHELCHILEHNHSGRFYAHVERVLPDYKSRQRLLRR